jgi:N-acetylglutamate synthase-like GNAT family acetyltransferase
VKQINKFINKRKYTFLEVDNSDSISNLRTVSSKSGCFTFNPPVEFYDQLLDLGFLQSESLSILKSTCLKKYKFPEGFSFLRAKISDIPDVMNIGEENYPEWLKQDYSFYSNCIKHGNKELFITKNNKGEIIGKIVIERIENECRIRAFGIKEEFTRKGIGKAMVASVSRNDDSIYSVFSLLKSVKFWKKIGFIQENNVTHWIKNIL